MLETTVVTKPDDAFVGCARHLLDHALPPHLRDDRFDDTWVDEIQEDGSVFVGAMARLDGHPLGLVTGTASRGRLWLDSLVSPHHDLDQPQILDDLLTAIGAEVEHLGTEEIELWGRPALDFHEKVAVERGLTPHRTLHQMRCSLPIDGEVVATRAFRPGEDDESLRLVNNAAFVGHPDQGDLSPADLAAKMAEPWFRPEGVRLHTVARPGGGEELVGFCWTKIHPDQGEGQELGEIYAIGIHPDHHGKGLGRPMTNAGLAWLADQGITTGMLYVEGDNAPALATYRRIGFEIVRTDRSWRRGPTVDDLTARS